MTGAPFSVAATLRLRHGRLTQLLAEKGWSQRELARYLEVPWQTVHAWLKLQRRAPTDPEVLRKLMELTGCTDEELFPPAIYARPGKDRPRTTQLAVRDVPLDLLLPSPRLALPMAPSAEEAYTEGERQQVIEQALATLTPQEARIVVGRFGLHGEDPQSLETLAQHYGVSRTRIQQLETRALQKLRSLPACQRLLRPLLTGEPLAPLVHTVVHPPAVVAPYLAPAPGVGCRPAPVRSKVRYVPRPPMPEWPPAPVVAMPPVLLPAHRRDSTPVVRVPADLDEVEHNLLDAAGQCLSVRPKTRGLLVPCTCGAVALCWQ